MRLSSTSSVFARVPSVKVPRTRFKIPVHSTKTTFNNGELIPIKAMEILPGDTVSLDLASVVRMNTPVKPVMDNVFMDVYFFFVPRRLVWKHWKEFMGENNTSAWRTSVEYNLPHTKSPRLSHVTYDVAGGADYWFKPITLSSEDFIGSPSYAARLIKRGVLFKKSGNSAVKLDTSYVYVSTDEFLLFFQGWDVNSLAVRFGAPAGSICEIDSGYLRAYALIYNEFFRDQNYMNPIDFQFDNDSDVNGASSAQSLNYTQYAVLGGKPIPVSRFHDYFSSVLPEPQFGDPVKILGSALAPVVPGDPVGAISSAFYWRDLSTGLRHSTYGHLGTQGNGVAAIDGVALGSGSSQVVPDNLRADLQSVSPTIQDLRTAFQVQKYLERSGRYGHRYTEIILGQFGVVNPDYRLQRPELLASSRSIIQVNQVLQTSSTDVTSPQGNTSAYSLTVGKKSLFTKSFTEHGILIGLACTRTSRTYQQGVPRWLSRRKRLDFYFPVFAHLSEQPILNKEIFCHFTQYADNAYTYPDEVFGYQEAWSEYRYMNSLISGEFLSMAPQSLDFWHYGDYYLDDVYASDKWLYEMPDHLGRTLAVDASISAQFYADFAFDITAVRPMPLYSVPGLADHF